jgi:hypothetical protein
MFEEQLEQHMRRMAELNRARKEKESKSRFLSEASEISEDFESAPNDDIRLMMLCEKVEQLAIDLESLKKLISTEVPDRKSVEEDMGSRREVGPALDRHARDLMQRLIGRPGIYTTDQLVELMDMNKPAVIAAMRRANELDSNHFMLSAGRRRRIFLNVGTFEEGASSGTVLVEDQKPTERIMGTLDVSDG